MGLQRLRRRRLGGFEDEIPNGGLGIYRLGEYARALSYGARSGIQLPGEARGLIPDPRWKRINQGENWSTGDTYIATVGQGYVLSTPLQVLLSGATLANNGKLMQPTVVRQISDADGKAQTVWFTPSDFTLWMPVPGSGQAAREGETWMNLADGTEASSVPEGSYQISPFVPNVKWDTYHRSAHRRIRLVADWQDPDIRRMRWEALRQALDRLAADARAAGLDYLVVENLAAARDPSTMV